MDLEGRMDRVESSLATLVGVVAGLAHVFEDAQRRNEERFAQNEERFAKLASAQADLDEKFGVLVKMMDEWIRNGRK